MLFSFRVLSSLFYFLIVKYFHVFHVLYFFFILHIFVFFMFFQISSFFFHTFIPFRGPPAFYISPPPFLTSSSSICDTRYSIANNSFRPRATLITINPIYLSLFDYQKFYTHYHITRSNLLKTLDELIFTEIIRINILIHLEFLRDRIKTDS